MMGYAATGAAVAVPPQAQRRLSGSAVTFGGRAAAVAVRCVRTGSVGLDAAPLVGLGVGEGRPLAERFRTGRLEVDGLSYKENFIVRSYEVGINKTATVETMANLLQEVACNQVQSIGISSDGFCTTNTMRQYNLIWVTTRMHIEIYKYPAWGDVIEMETWFEGVGIGTRRDWIIKDLATGSVIGRATSKWAMMNQETRKVQRVTDEIAKEYIVFSPRTPRLAFPEEDSSCLMKIPKLEDPAQYSRLGLVPRRADLDMNQHVNNVTYIGWVLESMPQEIVDTHELQTITLDYRRECLREGMVDSFTSVELLDCNSNGSARGKQHGEEDHCQLLHFMKLSGVGHEINRGRSVWRKLLR